MLHIERLKQIVKLYFAKVKSFIQLLTNIGNAS